MHDHPRLGSHEIAWGDGPGDRPFRGVYLQGAGSKAALLLVEAGALARHLTDDGKAYFADLIERVDAYEAAGAPTMSLVVEESALRKDETMRAVAQASYERITGEPLSRPLIPWRRHPDEPSRGTCA